MNSVHDKLSMTHSHQPEIFNKAYNAVNNINVWYGILDQTFHSIREDIYINKLYQVHSQLRETVND